MKSEIDTETAFRCLRNYLIGNLKGADFIDIENLFDNIGFDYKGSKMIGYKKNSKVVVWDGWNNEAISLINALLKDGFIIKPAPAILYNFKGHISKLPVIYSGVDAKYDTYHWAPMRIIEKRTQDG